MSNTTTASNQTHTQEALTEWYESQVAEGNNFTYLDFSNANAACEYPLDNREAKALYDELKRKRERENRYPKGITAAELQGKTFAPIRWVVPGILPEGVTLLSGKPKMGKSWLALGWCLAVATGGTALGKRKVEQGGVAYFALEDNQRRIRSRMNTMLRGEPLPENLHIFTDWPKFDAANMGELKLRYWLEDHPDTRLIVIDTIKKIRPRTSGNQNMYHVDYEAVEPLMTLAAAFNVGIVAVHHNNKMTDPDDPFDAVSGSTGLTGGVDTVLVLNRTRGNADAFLYVDGRDIEEQGKHPLQWDPQVCSWTLQDGEPIRYEMSEERRVIYDALPEYGTDGIGPKVVAEVTGMTVDNVKKLLGKMVDATPREAYKAGYGKYTKPINTTNNGPSVHGGHSIHGGHIGHSSEKVTATGQSGTPTGNDGHSEKVPFSRENVERVTGVNGMTRESEDSLNTQDEGPYPLLGGCKHEPLDWEKYEVGGCWDCQMEFKRDLAAAHEKNPPVDEYHPQIMEVFST